MLKNSKQLIVAIVMSLLTSLPLSYAQSLDTITDFKLNSEENTSTNLDSLPTTSDLFKNEFNLSLGSQILSYQNVGKIFPSEAEHIDTGFVGLALTDNFSDSVKDNNNQKDLKSVITLNSSYEDNAIGFNDSGSSALSLSGL